MFVYEDGVEVGVHANAIAEHLLLVVEEAVGAEVLREIHPLVHDGAAAAAISAAVREAPHQFNLRERVRAEIAVRYF